MRFSSKPWMAPAVDDSAGMYYYGYRFYDPLTQRWVNRDPIGEVADRNLYRLVYNSPINFVDPDGLWGVQFGGNGRNWGIGDPTFVFDNESWGHLGEGAVATIDGFIPFGDPLANRFQLYDPCDKWLKGSQFIGTLWREATVVAIGGAVIEGAIGASAYSQLSTAERLFINRSWVGALVNGSVSPRIAAAFQAASLTLNGAHLWDIVENVDDLLNR